VIFFFIYYSNLTSAYGEYNIDDVHLFSQYLLELIDDMETILNTNEYWLLGPWLEAAKSLSNITTNQQLLEFNARNQITLWGNSGEISDYASKQWGGLVSSYYKKRWVLFFEMLNNTMSKHHLWNQTAFNDIVFNTVEWPWQISNQTFPVIPVGDTIAISCQLYNKWNLFNNKINC